MRQKIIILCFVAPHTFDLTYMREISFQGIVSKNLIDAFFCHLVGFCDLWLQDCSLLFSSYYFGVFGEYVYSFYNRIE